MGFINDTIRDARRPLNPAKQLRRQMIDEIETESPEESPPTPGMQTVFRYQQANALAAVTAVPAREFREASIQPTGESLLPASDPLTAGEGPSEPASNVLHTDISVRGDRRISNLITGQEVSSSKVTAANVVPVSEFLQSDNSSGFSAPDSHRATQFPEIQASSETTVSPRAKTPLSQPGRGASSEFFPEVAGEASPDITPQTARSRQMGAASQTNLSAVISLELKTSAASPQMPAALDVAATTMPRSPQSASAHANPASHAGRRPDPTTYRATAPTVPAEPSLVIGRIDVLVVAPPAPASLAHAPTERGFLSRNYLKRL